MKWLLRIVIILVIVVIVVLGAIWLLIDSIAKKGIETGGSTALGVETTVQDVNLSILRGSITIEGLNIANPEPFDAPHLMHTGTFTGEVGKVMGDPVEIRNIELDGLDVYVQQQLGEGSNVGVIMDNLKKMGGPEDEDAEPKEGKRVKIDRFLIKNVTAHVQPLPIGGEASTIEVKVDQIGPLELTSDDAKGVLLPELIRRLFPAIIVGIVRKGGDLIPTDLAGNLMGSVEGLVGELGGNMGELLKGVGGGDLGGKVDEVLDGALEEGTGDAIKDATEGVGDALKDIGGGLFGGDKDEE